MNKAALVSTKYVSSDTISRQGTYQSIQKYVKKGYSIKESRNGFWVLIKPVQIMVTLKDLDGNRQTFNMKEDILRYYRKTRISGKLAERFEDDVEEGKIQLFMDDNGYCFE